MPPCARAHDRAAGARGRSCRGCATPMRGSACGRGRALLHRPAGAYGGGASGRLPRRGLDRRRTRRDRPPRHPGAAAARARPGPGGNAPVLAKAGGGIGSSRTPSRPAPWPRARRPCSAIRHGPVRARPKAARNAGAADAAERLAEQVLRAAGFRRFGQPTPAAFAGHPSCTEPQRGRADETGNRRRNCRARSGPFISSASAASA